MPKTIQMMLLIPLLVIMNLNAQAIQPVPNPVPRISIRQQNGGAEFYNTATGENFIARGVNYIGWKQGADARYHDWVFETRQFDPDEIRRAFHELSSHGYNTARIFLDICSQGPGCISLGGGGLGLNPDYLDNIVTVMNIAAEAGIYLILTSNDLPEAGGYWQQSDQGISPTIGGYRNANYLTVEGIAATRRYWQDLMSGLAARNAPFEVVLGWSLLNEQFFLTDLPPFTLDAGLVTTSTGTYDMADAGQRRLMTSDALNYYIDQVSAVIHRYDPDGLITMGFFAPDFPHRWRSGDDFQDNRLVDTQPILESSSLDFFDFHTYPGAGVPLEKLVENFGMPGYVEKPIIMGEVGAFNFLYENPSNAAYALQQWIAASCEHGFDGWLIWEYYGDPGPIEDGVWGFDDQGHTLRDALAPVHQPDACIPTDLRLPNAALGKPVTASQSLPSEAPANATDGSAAQWGSGGHPPQWVEVDLGAAVSIQQVRLLVGQYPAGETHHIIYAQLSDGSDMVLAEIQQQTEEGQWLEVALPAALDDVERIRVETIASPSWVSWKEIEVLRAESDLPPE